MQGKLTRLTSNHNILRTDDITGSFMYMPAQGDQFTIVGTSLTATSNHRIVTTSPIQLVIRISETELEFRTLNSHYKLEVYASD